MNSAFTPEKYLAKAERALRAAQLLSQAGEIEGACNRAYYAMYDAAHAALLAQNRADYMLLRSSLLDQATAQRATHALL